ncbi:hypothetical protein PVAG01_05319 [Phlyctema vagabunda]|uniref:Uncharacterized protein n=1 Tax=Phlyctema vagabunda TaxID=108571 RepID=A0ABR4PJQ5_9HELO
MEGLQFAQVLADISQLQTAEPSAALNFLQVNKRISEWSVRRKSQHNLLPNERPQFDRLGRRITGAPVESPPAATPAPITHGSDVPSGFTATSASDKTSGSDEKGLFMPSRVNSALAPGSKALNTGNSSANNSGASTPPFGIDTELERAKALMQLYEIRGKLRRQEGAGLTKATERVQVVAARYTQLVQEQRRKELEAKRQAQNKGANFLTV